MRSMSPSFRFLRTLPLLIIATGHCCAPIAEASDARATYHAAQRGNVDAMRKMGVWSRDGKKGIPRSYSTAEDWFQKAANTGDVQALFLLGDLYKNRGNKPKSALECYTKAHRREPEKAKKKIFTLPFSIAKETIEEWAEKGDEDCLKFLLEAYLQGKHGISRNIEKASPYYKIAERQHPALAQKFAKKLSEAELQRLNPEAHREKAAQERAAAAAEQARQQAESERAAREARERAERERRLAEEAKRTQQEKLKAQQESLKQAFAHNDAAKAQKLIKDGVQIERSAIEDALIEAVKKDLSIETLRLAQAQGVDLQFMRNGESLLHIAAQHKPSIVQTLLEMKLDPNLLSAHGGTALVSANNVQNKEDALKITQLLLNAGADPNKRASHGGVPILGAALNGETEKIKLLLKAGADPNITNYLGDGIYLNPLLVAFMAGHADCVEALLKAGADPNIQLGQDPLLVKILFSGDKLPSNSEQMLHSLLKHGANPNAQGEAHFTPLMLAAGCKRHELVDKLLEFKTNPNTTAPRWGLTALHCAIAAENSHAVRSLIKAGARLNPTILETPPQLHEQARNTLQTGDTPLHTATSLASEESRRAITHILLNAGADASATNLSGATPSDLARNQGDELLSQQIAEKMNAAQTKVDFILYGSVSFIMGLIVLIVNFIRGRELKKIKSIPPVPPAL